MLWYKSFLETRWRFVIGAALLPLSAAGSVLAYPRVVKLLPLATQVDVNDPLGRRVLEAAQVMTTYRGYVWAQWYAQNMTQQLTLFAILLGAGGLLAQKASGGALFTLSLPVTRDRLIGVRAATGLAELLVLAIAPAVVVPLLSPMVGERYSFADALAHAGFMFVGGSVFFGLAFFLSATFNDVWRPVLVVVCVGMALGFVDEVFRAVPHVSIFELMNGESYFRGEGVPWLGLLASVVVSAVLLIAATRNIARRDF